MKWLLLCATFFAFPAHAYSGKELREDCLAAEASVAPNASINPYKSAKGARCIGYLEGFVDGYAISDHLAESVGVQLNAFCLPKSPDLSYRLVRSVLAHLDRQPPNPESSTATLVAAALSKTFPCTESLEPKK
jgi:Rap1a immunity proteins